MNPHWFSLPGRRQGSSPDFIDLGDINLVIQRVNRVTGSFVINAKRTAAKEAMCARWWTISCVCLMKCQQKFGDGCRKRWQVRNRVVASILTFYPAVD